MITEEWKLIEEIVRSTIRMHLAENVYFRMPKETMVFTPWEELQAVYEKYSSSSKLRLIRKPLNMMIGEIDPKTSQIKAFSWVLSKLSSQGINFEEEVTAFRAYQRFGRYSAQHSPTAT